MEMLSWAMVRGFKEQNPSVPRARGKETPPSARCFGFLSGWGCSQDIEGWVRAVCGAVGTSTASPRGSPTSGTCEEGHGGACVSAVGTEIQRDVQRRSCRLKIPGRKGKKNGSDLCPLLLSIGHGSAPAARWEVKGGSGEGLRGQTAAVSGTRRASEELSVCSCCSAAKPSPAAGTSRAAPSVPASSSPNGRILLPEELRPGR